MKPAYINAVKEGDTESVRLFLSDEILLDPRGIGFWEMRNYAESEIADLYEPDNGKNYSTDRTEWNEELLYQVKNDLDLNFSRYRLDFYVEVALVVLAEKAKHMGEEELRVKRRAEPSCSIDDTPGQKSGEKRQRTEILKINNIKSALEPIRRKLINVKTKNYNNES